MQPVTFQSTLRARLVRSATLTLLAGTFAAAAWAQADPTASVGDNRNGTVKAVQGQVQLARGSERRALVVGDGVLESDRIVTGEKSAASITLRDGSVVSVGPQSDVVLTQFKFDSTTQDGSILVRLAQGSLRMVTGVIAKGKPEQVKVTTPTTVIGVRGTDFIVEAAPQ